MTTDSPPAMVSTTSERTRRLVEHLREPLHRNAYALVASTFSTSILGALYWAIAAHQYTSRQVGLNSSLITTMMFLTNLASLNFTDVLNRFVPVSGRRSARLVWFSYAIAVALGGVSATVFVLGLGWFSPDLKTLLHGPLLAVIYVAATMLWVIFVLQDAVLIAVRRAMYVLLENTSYGIVKIVLLVGLAAALPSTGIFISWTLPLVAVVLVVNFAVFRLFLPGHAADATANHEDFNRKHISRFVVADYIASMLWTATIALMPLYVLNRLGPSPSAYVYLAWTIAYTLYLATRNMGMSLTTEGARDPARLAEHTRATLKSAARIVVPAALLLTVAAPLFLDVFGAEYSTHGTMLLRLLALSTIPAIIPITFVSVARVQQRLLAMVVVTAATTVPVVVLVPPLVHWFGIAGVGWAWLVVQTAVAAVLLTGEWRNVWHSTSMSVAAS
jgi:O-antigen/teichoic acid export membrane protein